MVERIAMVGAFGRLEWLEAHIAWLKTHGPHQDGWEQKNIIKFAEPLQKEIAEHNVFHLYIYLSKKAGGDGTVQFRAKVSRLVTYPESPVEFRHPMHGGDPWTVRSVMTYSAIEKWRLLLQKLTSYDGSSLDPKRLLNEFIPIVDPHPVSL